MRNLLLILQYNGANYHGSQVQKNGYTICEAVQDALEKIIGSRVPITACSRTDTGVHAKMFCVNFRTEKPILPQKLKNAMNFHLPWDIRVSDCREVDLNFHSRYDAVGKKYVYKIWNADYENPFLKDMALHYPWKIDEELLNRACQYYIGTHDFSAFCSAQSDIEDKVRTVTECSVTRNGDVVEFTVCGDGFLHNMVRIMVGTLLGVNEGKWTPEDIESIINSKDRSKAGVTAKACGLYLWQVFYK